MSIAWLLLILAVTVGNLALGFALACLFGHGPKLPDVQQLTAPLLTAVKDSPILLREIIRSQKSPRSPP